MLSNTDIENSKNIHFSTLLKQHAFDFKDIEWLLSMIHDHLKNPTLKSDIYSQTAVRLAGEYCLSIALKENNKDNPLVQYLDSKPAEPAFPIADAKLDATLKEINDLSVKYQKYLVSQFDSYKKELKILEGLNEEYKKNQSIFTKLKISYHENQVQEIKNTVDFYINRLSASNYLLNVLHYCKPWPTSVIQRDDVEQFYGIKTIRGSRTGAFPFLTLSEGKLMRAVKEVDKIRTVEKIPGVDFNDPPSNLLALSTGQTTKLAGESKYAASTTVMHEKLSVSQPVNHENSAAPTPAISMIKPPEQVQTATVNTNTLFQNPVTPQNTVTITPEETSSAQPKSPVKLTA